MPFCQIDGKWLQKALYELDIFIASDPTSASGYVFLFHSGRNLSYREPALHIFRGLEFGLQDDLTL